MDKVAERNLTDFFVSLLQLCISMSEERLGKRSHSLLFSINITLFYLEIITYKSIPISFLNTMDVRLLHKIGGQFMYIN